jgi:hypothetical protein
VVDAWTEAPVWEAAASGPLPPRGTRNPDSTNRSRRRVSEPLWAPRHRLPGRAGRRRSVKVVGDGKCEGRSAGKGAGSERAAEVQRRSAQIPHLLALLPPDRLASGSPRAGGQASAASAVSLFLYSCVPFRNLDETDLESPSAAIEQHLRSNVQYLGNRFPIWTEYESRAPPPALLPRGCRGAPFRPGGKQSWESPSRPSASSWRRSSASSCFSAASGGWS